MNRFTGLRRHLRRTALMAAALLAVPAALLVDAAMHSPALAAVTQLGPRVATIEYNGAFNVFARGSDGHLRQWYYDGTWHDYIDLGGSLAADSGPSVTTYNGQLQVWARGSDSTLRQWWWHDGTWHNNINFGVAIISRPAIVQYFNQFQVFATATDGTLRQWWYDGTWHNDSFGASLKSGPAAAVYNGQLQVWATGSDETLRQWWYDGTWHNDNFPGSLASEPAITQYGSQFQVFATGTDGTLRQWWYDGTWHNNISLGGSLGSPPAVSLYGSQLQIWTRGSDGTLRQWWYDGTWHNNINFGHSLASGPAVATYMGQVQVWATTTDGPLHQWWYDGSWHDQGRGGLPPKRTDGLDKPIYFVHGYSGLADGVSCNGAYWASAINDYKNDGDPARAGTIKTVGFYFQDASCDVFISTGNHEVGIEELGRLFSWEIYDRYSQYGIAVDIVAHSMGGLIVRAMLTGIQRKLAGFAPYIYVEDVSTLAAPFGGVHGVAMLCLTHQCNEMKPGSAFLRDWMDDNPQADGTGTDWTLIGSYEDGTVSGDSATAMGHPGHKVIYYRKLADDQKVTHDNITNLTTGRYTYKSCHYYSGCDMNNPSTWPESTSTVDPVLRARLGNFYYSLD